jgi:hypothetical protein
MHIERNTDQDCMTTPAQSGDVRSTSTRSTPRTRQPWGPLLRSVIELAGERAQLVSHIEHDWASATFSGSRHALKVRFTGPDAAEDGEAFIVALREHEFVIPRWLVADAQIVAVDDQQLPQRTLVVEFEMLLLDRA